MASSEISASEGVEDERKREALRKAGQEYFERVLAEASTGKDPFAPEQITEIAPQREKRTGATRRARPQREDPDLEAVGAIISGAKLYILTAIFVGCKAAGFVFFKVRQTYRSLFSTFIVVATHYIISAMHSTFSTMAQPAPPWICTLILGFVMRYGQASLNPLETPGILTFLHLLPLMCVLLGFSGAFDLDPITLEGYACPCLNPSTLSSHHTHTHRHTRGRARAQLLTLNNVHIPKFTNIRNTHTHTHTHTSTHSRSRTHSHTHTHTHTLTLMNTLTNTLTPTHIHTHMCSDAKDM
jgi:hypothetical protein